MTALSAAMQMPRRANTHKFERTLSKHKEPLRNENLQKYQLLVTLILHESKI